MIAQPGDGVSDLRAREWDADRGLVVVDGGSAYWIGTDGGPRGDDVTILLTWHPDGAPGVRASGIVSGLLQISRHVDDVTAPIRRREVDAAEMFREPLVDADGYTLSSLVATLTDRVLVEPTLVEVAKHRAAIRRARSTVQISVPAGYFGDTTPSPGDRVTVDLDDPEIRIRSAGPAHGLASGVLTDITVSTRSRSGAFTILSAVAAGTLAAEVHGDLFIILVLDGDS